jgi:putative membrane protein
METRMTGVVHEEGPRTPDVVKGAVAGLIGGVVATWVMSEFQRLWTLAAKGTAPDSAGDEHDARDWQERHEDRNANEIAADAIARSSMGRRLTRDEMELAAPAVHYTFGSVLGAMYGGFSEVAPQLRAGAGSGYGTAVWAAADEIAMPTLGLSRVTTERPIELHLQSLASHIVFGVTMEFVRRGVRAVM